MNQMPISGRVTGSVGRRFARASLLAMTMVMVSALCVPPSGGQCPRHIGEAAHGSAYAVDIDGDRGLFGSGPVLMFVDLSDPSAPILEGEVVLGGLIRGLDQENSGDSWLAVAATSEGLFIVTTSPWGAPAVVGEYPDFGSLSSVSLEQDLVFTTYSVSIDESGILAFDIADPSNPVLIGQYTHPWYSDLYAVDIGGGFAYVTGTHEVLVLDVSDPTSPQQVATAVAGCSTRRLDVVGNFAYVACPSTGLKIFDITDPFAPILSGGVGSTDAWDVSVANTTAYVADGYKGLRVVDVSDPYRPLHQALVLTEGYTHQVGAVGELVVIADREAGFRIFDAEDPSSPTQIAEIPTPSQSGGLAVTGNHAFVTDLYKGMWVFDVTDASSPQRIALYPIPVSNNVGTFVRGVTVGGNLAFVSALHVHIIDISDPANPYQVGTLPDDGVGAVVNGLAYTGSSDGLCIVDISDPGNPVELGCLPVSMNTVETDGSYAYVGSNARVQIVDVRNPYVPFVARHVPTPGEVYGLTKVGDLLFVANRYDGLSVIDVADPVFATEIGACPIPGSALDVVVAGSTALVSGSWGGISVVDVSDPTRPNLVCTSTLPASAGSVAHIDDIGLVTAGDAGLWLFDRWTVELFADGFESGDTTAWSLVFPIGK